MPPTLYFKRVPKNPQQWQNAAEQANVTNKNLRSCNDLRSGSSITQEQFLLFRTICPKVETLSTFRGSNFNLAQNHIRARDILQGSADFQNYLDVLGTNKWRGIGKFERVLQQQYEIIRGFENPEAPLIEHREDVVNSSILLLLQTLLSLEDNPMREWRVSKRRLTADFNTASQFRNGTNSSLHRFVAITDGQLQDIATDKIEAIVECKQGRRDKHSPKVDMQEIAEIVAWIKQYPDPPSGGQQHQRVTVSQDGDELFISFHSYNDNWVDYLNNHGPTARTGFMETRRFGPCVINNAAQMQEYAAIVLAVAL